MSGHHRVEVSTSAVQHSAAKDPLLDKMEETELGTRWVCMFSAAKKVGVGSM